MSVIKMCDGLVAVSKPKKLRCPHCHANKLEVIVAKHADRWTIVKLICSSLKCSKRVAYDVQGGQPERKKP